MLIKILSFKNFKFTIQFVYFIKIKMQRYRFLIAARTAVKFHTNNLALL